MHKSVLCLKLTCAPMALSALVKLILVVCPCEIYCQCSAAPFSPQCSKGGTSNSGDSQTLTTAAAHPLPI